MKMTMKDWKCLRQPGVVDNVLQFLLYIYDSRSEDDPQKISTHLFADKDPTMVRIMFAMARELDPTVFVQASRQAFLNAKFAFLAKRLARNPERYTSEKAFERLFHKYDGLSPAVRRRYAATLFDWQGSAIIQSSLSIIGCMNSSCPTTSRLSGWSVRRREVWEKMSAEVQS